MRHRPNSDDRTERDHAFDGRVARAIGIALALASSLIASACYLPRSLPTFVCAALVVPLVSTVAVLAITAVGWGQTLHFERKEGRRTSLARVADLHLFGAAAPVTTAVLDVDFSFRIASTSSDEDTCTTYHLLDGRTGKTLFSDGDESLVRGMGRRLGRERAV